MERRGRGSGKVSHVECRECGAPVLIDSRVMVVKETHAELRCPACGAVVPVRRNDAFRGAPDGIWAIDTYSHAGTRPAGKHLHRSL